MLMKLLLFRSVGVHVCESACVLVEMCVSERMCVCVV